MTPREPAGTTAAPEVVDLRGGDDDMTDAATPGRPVADGSIVTKRAPVRGRRQSDLVRIRGTLEVRWRVGLAAIGTLLPIAAWWIVSTRMARPELLPTPPATWDALWSMAADGSLWTNGWASIQRILIGYSISVFIAVVLGIAIGTFLSFESFFEPQIGFLRYIPATALTPLLLLWLGIDESPKIWLIVIGTVFFNILMMADAARAVPRELLNASYTLGAGRVTVLRRVVLRYATPGIIDAARINLAAGWAMLVIAELLAAEAGLAFQIVRSQRFRAVDDMFALLFVLGLIGLCSDLFLRWLRNRVAPWARS